MIYNRHRARRAHSADIFTLPLLADFPTLHDALLRYQQTITPHKKGALQESHRIAIWLKHPLASQPLNALQGRHFSIYRDARISNGVSADTIRLELAIISNLYTVAAIDWGS